jgi:hypothetical protein
MSLDNKGVSKEEAIRRGLEDKNLAALQPEIAEEQHRKSAGQPAQVTPEQARQSHPGAEDVPLAGDMGPPEGPGS